MPITKTTTPSAQGMIHMLHSGDLVTCHVCLCVLLKQLMLLWLPQEVDGSCSMNIKTPFVCLALDLGGVMILRCCVITCMYSCLCVQEIVTECLYTAYTANSLLILTLYLQCTSLHTSSACSFIFCLSLYEFIENNFISNFLCMLIIHYHCSTCCYR